MNHDDGAASWVGGGASERTDRDTGIALIGRVPWGTHFCQFYATREDLAELLVPYFKAGLEQDEFCMWITSPPLGTPEAWEALARAVPDLDFYRARRRIEIMPHTEWYLEGGRFDQERVLRGWVDKLEDARARGCAGLRLSGNTFWLEKSDWRSFADYEHAVDGVIGNYPMLALCTYALERCGASEVADVIKNHQFALIKRDRSWELFESFDRRRAQERAEGQLRESERRYRSLFENLSEAFALHEMIYDEQGQPRDYRFLEVNQSFERFTGFSRDRVVGRTLLEILPGIEPVWLQRYGEVVRKGEPIRFAQHSDALGRDYDVIAFRPRPGQFATLFVDLTEQKRLERLYAVLSQVNEAIVRATDETALLRDVCRIVVEQGGFPLAWIGLVDGHAVVPRAWSGPQADYLRRIKVEVEGDLGNGPTGTCIRENRSVVNDDFATNVSALPWREPALDHGFRASAAFPLCRSGQAIGALTLYAARPGAFDAAQIGLLEALSADVSYALAAIEQDRRRTAAEEALREADRRKNEFLAVLSHELRNPLAPIRNSLFVLERAAPGGEQARRAQAVIDRQVGQLVRLVDDLLDVTRITRNKIHLQRERLDLNEIVRRTLEDQRPLLEENEVALELSLAPGGLFVDADASRLAQIVGNLVQNAGKFTGRGGRVSVSLAADFASRRAVLRIADTGVGMEAEMLARLFEPFMQAESTIDRSRGGLGLGLALVKGLVELHGGSISAHSEGVGKGAEFTVRLPLATQGIGEDLAATPASAD